MGKKTSVYLTDDLAAAVAASGVGIGELVRRGLNWEAVTIRQAAAEAVEQVSDELDKRIDRAVERALRKMQGG